MPNIFQTSTFILFDLHSVGSILSIGALFVFVSDSVSFTCCTY